MSWGEPVEIRTPRLILRSARPDDLEAMHAVLSDPRATLWWSTPPHETLEQTAAWLDAMIANGADHPDFVVERDGRVIGKAGFFRLPDVGMQDVADLGQFIETGLAYDPPVQFDDEVRIVGTMGDHPVQPDPRLLQRLVRRRGPPQRCARVGEDRVHRLKIVRAGGSQDKAGGADFHRLTPARVP